MQGFVKRHLSLIAYLLLAAGVVAALSVAALDRSHIKKEALIACLDNEKQNKLIREEARESYRNLDETLELLGIKRTTRIERRAKLNRDTTLSRFAPQKCPRNGD